MSESNGRLRSIVERIQRLDEEEASIKDDKKDIYAEAKSNGFNPKIIRALIKHLKQDPSERDQFDTEFDLYLRAFNGNEETGMNRATQAGVREGSIPNFRGDYDV